MTLIIPEKFVQNCSCPLILPGESFKQLKKQRYVQLLKHRVLSSRLSSFLPFFVAFLGANPPVVSAITTWKLSFNKHEKKCISSR